MNIALDRTYPTHENSDYTPDTTYSVFPTVYTHTHTQTSKHTHRCRWQRGVKASVCCHSLATTAGSNPAGGRNVYLLRMLFVVR